jgi:putative DNA methylase
MAKAEEQLAFYFVKTAADPAAQSVSFPEEEANVLAAMESYNKHLYRPNTYLHKWWARRCGTTFRYILKQFVPDTARRDFYAPGGLEGFVILDPMMGGGTTVHEAIRLGANVAGGDIDPIPVLQARATLTPVSETHFRATFRGFISALRAELSPYYATRCPVCGRSDAEFRFTLYALRRRCACGEALLVDSFILRREASRTIQLCPRCHTVFSGEHTCTSVSLDQRPLREKRTRICPSCGQPYNDLTELPFRQRYTPIAIVGECPQHNLFFKSPESDDLARLAEAEANFGDLDFGDREQFTIVPGPKSKDLPRLGIRYYLDLFSARQLGYIAAVHRQLREVEEPTERLILALLVSTSLEFNSMLCGYKGGNRRRPGAIRHTFSHHAYSFPYTAAENNPLFPLRGSGTLVRLSESRVIKARRWAVSPVERRIEEKQTRKVAIVGERDLGQEVFSPEDLREGSRRFFLYQGDSRCLPLEDASVDYVVTDPPYYDSVQYSDLAAFFRVWLQLFLPDEARWDYDAENSAVARGDQPTPGRYGEILRGIFSECQRVLKPGHGRLAFTFHHWRPRAWAELTVALKRAGFHLEEYYVVQSENPISVHIRSLRALKHDAVLVLAPAATGHAWPIPDQVDLDDSRAFIADCSGVLGWILDSDCDEDKILECWTVLLERGNNGDPLPC